MCECEDVCVQRMYISHATNPQRIHNIRTYVTCCYDDPLPVGIEHRGLYLDDQVEESNWRQQRNEQC